MQAYNKIDKTDLGRQYQFTEFRVGANVPIASEPIRKEKPMKSPESICEVRRFGRPITRIRAAATVWLLAAIPVQSQLVIQRVYTGPQGYPTVAPFSSLVQALDGNFYGTIPSLNGSSYPNGGVFRLTPRGVFTTVASFMGSGGKDPEGALVLGTDGNLYGTAFSGGSYGVGTLFKVTTSGSVQLLHSFTGSDTACPQYALLQASDGFLYGVTATVNATNHATIFRANTSGAVTVLTNFSRSSSGTPNDGLAEGADGCFYGTTASGSASGSVIGSIYKVTPGGSLRTLATFYDYSGFFRMSNQPMCGLTAGPNGLLYGTLGHSTLATGAGNGSVFSITTNGVLTTIFTFQGTNGSNPSVRLILGNDGAFYGQTASGGPHGVGTTFRITTTGQMTILADGVGNQFRLADSGAPPLIQANDGNLYNTAVVSSRPFAYRLVSPLAIMETGYAGGSLTLTWNSFLNGAYQVYYKNAPTDASWTTQGSVIVANGPITSTTCGVTAAPQRVYQVVLLP